MEGINVIDGVQCLPSPFVRFLSFRDNRGKI